MLCVALLAIVVVGASLACFTDKDAKDNVLYFNYAPDSIGAGKRDWSKTAGAPYQGD